MVTDKNGKELYCGDLVRINSDSEGFCEGDNELTWVIIRMRDNGVAGVSEIYIKSGWENRLAYSYDIEKIEDENKD